MKKIAPIIVLSVLFCLAVFLRWYLLPSHLFFGPEQGRDMLVIRDIVVGHKLTLIGSKTDVGGIFHGPIFYYLSAIPFALSKGNPLVVSLFMILIQGLGVFFMYFLGRDITNSKRTGLIAAALYTISFLAIVYARWLSNPPLSIPLSILCIWGVVRFLQGDKRFLFLIAISFACLGQAEFINFLLFFGVAIGVGIRYLKNIKRISFLYIAAAVIVAAVCSLGTYVLFDIRHELLISKSVFSLVSGSSGFGTTLISSIQNSFTMFISQFGMLFGIVQWNISMILFAIVFLLLLVERKTYQYIDIVLIWLIVPVCILMLLRNSILEQLFVGLVPGMILAASIAISWLLQKVRFVGIVAGVGITAVTMFAYTHFLPTNSYVFFQSPQPNVRYSDELEVVRRIFKLAGGKNFFFQAYTIPYFWQDAWTYLFWYQGTVHYGYIPKEEETSDVYVIIQKDRADTLYQDNWYKKTVSTWGVKTEGFTLGEYTVEIRQRAR